MKSGVVRFSVSTDPELLDEFDNMIRQMDYQRSSAIQIAMRNFLTDYKWTMDLEANVVGAITMIYDHDVRGLVGNLIHIQHHHIKAITSTTHVHLDDHNCLEIIAVRGSVKAIKELAEKLITTKGVKQLKIVTLMI